MLRKVLFVRESIIFVLILVIIASSLLAVKYYYQENIFDAKITFVNDEKMPYSILYSLENKINESLNFDLEIVYKRKNLVVGTEKIKCDNICEGKILLNKVFFDKYELKVKTKYNGEEYEKKIKFKIEKPKSKNNLTLESNFFYIEENKSSINITGKIIVDKPSKIYLETFPTKLPNDNEYKTTKRIKCSKECNFNLEIKSSILFGKYYLNVYFENDVLQREYDIRPAILKEEGLIIKTDINEEDIIFCKNEEEAIKKNCISSNNYELLNFPEEIFLGDEIEFDILLKDNQDIYDFIDLLELNNFNSSNSLVNNNSINNNSINNNSINNNIINNNSNSNLLNINRKKPIKIKTKINSLKDLDFLKESNYINYQVKKDRKLLDFELKNNLIVYEYDKKPNQKEDIAFIKSSAKIKFKNTSLNNIKKVEIVNPNSLQNFNENYKKILETEIINVEADNFEESQIILKKNSDKKITKILTCKNLISGECLDSWINSNINFMQNITHVWFNVTHFSAYAGIGPTYEFDVDFFDYSDQIVKKDKAENVEVVVNCDNTGDCGDINVTLYYLIKNYSFFDGFEAGSLNTSFWQFLGSNGFARQRVINSGCGITANSGSWFVAFDSNTNNNYETSVLKSVFDFTHFRLRNIDMFITDTADEDNRCFDHTGDFCNGEGTFFTCDGNQWYEIDYYEPSTLADNVWSNRNIDISSDSNFCSYLDENFAIKFTQYDNYVCGTDGIFFDDINLTGDRGFIVQNSTQTPLYIIGSQVRQINLNQSQSRLLNFQINATGNVGDLVDIYVEARSSNNSSVVSLSNDKTLSIADSTNPKGYKLSPSSSSVLKHNHGTVTNINVIFLC